MRLYSRGTPQKAKAPPAAAPSPPPCPRRTAFAGYLHRFHQLWDQFQEDTADPDAIIHELAVSRDMLNYTIRRLKQDAGLPVHDDDFVLPWLRPSSDPSSAPGSPLS
jgi:hypothetical protein